MSLWLPLKPFGASPRRCVGFLFLVGVVACAFPIAARSISHGCVTDPGGQVACTVPSGVTGVTVTDYSTGLPHAGGFQDVDVINLTRACRLVRLYYTFGFQGDFHVLPPVNVPIRQVAITDSGPWTVRSPSWLTRKIRSLLRQNGVPAPTAASYSLPYPTAYWYVFVAHTEAEGLARGGVRCVR